MPGWVLPAVAAELWGVSIEQVMADVAAGRVSSRVEGEFIFVDVQPGDDADQYAPDEPATTPPPYRRSLAWSVPASELEVADPIVTAEERDALVDDPTFAESLDDAWPHEDPACEDEHAEDADEESDVDAPEGPVVLTADDVPNWGEVRSRVARTRRPPRRILDAA